MTFIVNGERWVSLIEAVRRSYEASPIQWIGSHKHWGSGLFALPITCAPDVTQSDIRYYDQLMCQCFPDLPWNGALFYEWSK